MITPEDIIKFASLARIKVSDKESESLKNEIESIIAYVSAIQDSSVSEESDEASYMQVRNVLRDDMDAHKTGEYTDILLKQVPRTKDNYVVVKKILSNNQ